MKLGERASKALKCAAIVLATAVGLALLLLACAMVPREAIQPKMRQTATWMANQEQVDYAYDYVLATQLHYSADAVWLSIAYDFDETDPLESMIWARYAQWPGETMNGSLYQSVKHERPGTQEYLRYWHGPAGIMRVLHLFLNIEQIYGLLCVLVAVLFVALLVLLWRHGLRGEAAAFALAMFMVSAWIAPLCLEYVWIFLVMLVASLVIVRRESRGASGRLPVLFLGTGEGTAFLDFLTTETLTLTIPILLVLRARKRWGRESDARRIVGCCIAWLVGFAGMWAAKWALSSVVLGTDVMPYVNGHVTERLAGDVGLALGNFLVAALARNVLRLFVFDYGTAGTVVLCALMAALVIPLLAGKLRVRGRIDWKAVLVYVGIALLPYVRYLVLHNHAYGHYCFTYRAQAATVMALCFVVMELLEPVSKPAAKRVPKPAPKPAAKRVPKPAPKPAPKASQ